MQYQKKIILLLLIPFLMWSQEKEIYATPDALKSEIVKILYNNPNKALELATAFLDYGIETKDEKIQSEAYHQLGKVNGVKGNHLEAIRFYDKGIGIAKKINYKEYLIELIVVKGNAFYHLNKNVDALNSYLNALELTDAPNYNSYQWIILMNLALLKQRNGNFEEATTLFKNSLDLAYKYPNTNKTVQTNTVANILMNLGEAYLKRKLLDSSIYFNQIGLKKSLVYNNLQTSSNLLKLIGKAYYEKGNYDKAITELKKAKTSVLSIGNPIIENEIYLLLGLSYFKIKEFDISIFQLEKCITQYKEEKENISIATYQEACIALAKIYNEKENIKQSKIFYEKYIAVNNSLKEQETTFLKEYYKNDVAQLKSEINTYQSRISKQQLYLIISILFIILLSLATYNYKSSLKNILLKTNKPANLTNKTNKSETIIIDSKKVTSIIKELKKLEKEEFYIHKNCNLYTTAKKLNTNTSYLSKIMNEVKKQSFNAYLNDLRIQYAIDKIHTDKTFRSYSIKSIAEEIGYKSANSFSKYFKIKTGSFPSAFIKHLKQQK